MAKTTKNQRVWSIVAGSALVLFLLWPSLVNQFSNAPTVSLENRTCSTNSDCSKTDRITIGCIPEITGLKIGCYPGEPGANCQIDSDCIHRTCHAGNCMRTDNGKCLGSAQCRAKPDLLECDENMICTNPNRVTE